jgi:hypothetical protein
MHMSRIISLARLRNTRARSEWFRAAIKNHGYKYGIGLETRGENGGRTLCRYVDPLRPVNGTHKHETEPATILDELVAECGRPALPQSGDVRAAVDLIAEAFPGFTVGLLLTPKT